MRKKWMKKTGAAILAAVMAMSVLAGCSGSGIENDPDSGN